MTKRKFSETSLKNYIKRDSRSLFQIAEYFNVTPKEVTSMLAKLKKGQHNILEDTTSMITLGTDMNVGVVTHPFDPNMWFGDKLRFGFTSDNHLCNINSREDVLNLLYDIFQLEGLSVVYNGGNMVDGEFLHNKNEISVHGCTNQLRYLAKNYPVRPGIITKFVVGDDHEGWWTQREGIDVGNYIVQLRKEEGNDDFEYMGYGEADINLSEPGQQHESWLRLVHAGGGTAYAISYTMQKLIESYQGGEKPTMLLAGHYHKFDYSFPREVHAIQMGTTCDQTLFMRKKKLQAMVGGGIVEATRAADGTINRVKVEWIPFYDKGFYKGKDKYFKGI
jgi:hypothetical protein